MSMQRQNTQITMDVGESSHENCKKIADNNVPSLPPESLLGSITTNTLVKEEKGMQIRSSARVFKKMKLEQGQDKKKPFFNSHQVKFLELILCLNVHKHEDLSEISPTTTATNSDQSVVANGNAEKNVENEGKGQPIRCSTRVVKKVKLEPTVITETKTKKEEPKSDIKKEVRKWTYEDKMMFFEAINEYGRDFENIQQYINTKLKKKGASEEQIRSKEHVRHFYMRTFHEVSKHVKFSDSVKKVVQELYGIINYGELYKKLGVITEKAYLKLNELIYRGETCIRVKGKNNRIKTPMCRALIKLNQLDEKYEEIKLPNRVTVELRPKDMNSFIRVQCMAQNPRLRTTLPIQKRLNSLIQCLNKRWKSVDTLNYEKALVANNPITNVCLPSQQEMEEKMKLLTPPLTLSPPPEAKIELPSINISEYLTRQTICLGAYESRLGLDTFSEIKKCMSKKKKPKIDAEPKVEVLDTVKVEVKIEENEKNNCYEGEPDALLADAVHEAVNTILSLQTLDRQQSETSETEETSLKESLKVEIQPEVKVKSKSPAISKEDLEHIKNVRKGWNEASSESLTIGEIYLMYGSDTKLILEYSWGTDVKKESEKPKKTAANFLEMWNESFEESWDAKQRNLTSSLSKLLSLAKLHYRQNTINCPCGHVCNDGSLKSLSIGNSRVNRGLVVNDNSTLNSKPEDNMLLTVLPDVTNGKLQASSGLFRSPMHILPKGPTIQTATMQQQLNSIRRLKPKFSNRKGRRPRQKPIVVERKLPLLPNNLSGHQIVRMSIISQEPPVVPVESKMERMDENPISITNTLEQELNLHKVITDPEEDNSIISTVPSSPSRILKEGESEWINAEVADYSLSSLLGHLESPIKTPVPIGSMNSNMAADLSSEVDAQLQSLMTENSLDFAASFADLAASVVSDRNKF